MRIWLAVAATAVASAGWAQVPTPGDPAALVDLRWQARESVSERFVLDGWAGDEVGEIAGPGVLEYLMCGSVGELTIEVDGVEVLRCQPRTDWKPLYVEPKPEERGEMPFRWPLVHQGGPYGCMSLPIPFRENLRLTVTERPEQMWLSGRLLDEPAEVAFSGDAGSPYMQRLAEAQPVLEAPVDRLWGSPDAVEMRAGVHCPAGERATLVTLEGPGEVVGLRLAMRPGELELLRHPVIEIVTDGVASLRMPLVDLVGVSHPWPHAWQPRAGDHVAGLVHPYYRGGGHTNPAAVAYFKLPIPYAESLRIDIWNRSEELPVTFEGRLMIAQLAAGEPVGRLCGTSMRVDLPAEGEAVVWDAPGDGRLAGLSIFTTGHGQDWDWRRKSRVTLTDTVGDVSGAGLLPLAMQGTGGSNVIATTAWNHNSLEATWRCGAGRHFWTDPPDVSQGATISYMAEGADGPTSAEVGVVWYQWLGADAYEAPTIPADVVQLPPVSHGQPQRPLAGGWWLEAEELAAAAEASAGQARAETVGALDVFASGGAFLAWNADQPGDKLDLIAPMPESRYARMWYHRLALLAGGTFAIELAPPDGEADGFAYAKSSQAFLDRVLGRATARASIDCYGIWPHRQAYRSDMVPMLNPAPGELARIRFTCVTKSLASRGYLLAVDQIGVDPPPPAPEGWQEMESASGEGDLLMGLMPYGRLDFHGWGGLLAAGKGQARIALAASIGQAGANAIELRGVVEDGEWYATIDGAAEQSLAPAANPKEPALWYLPLPADFEAPGELTLTVRNARAEGSLMLDAWRNAGARE